MLLKTLSQTDAGIVPHVCSEPCFARALPEICLELWGLAIGHRVNRSMIRGRDMLKISTFCVAFVCAFAASPAFADYKAEYRAYNAAYAAGDIAKALRAGRTKSRFFAFLIN